MPTCRSSSVRITFNEAEMRREFHFVNRRAASYEKSIIITTPSHQKSTTSISANPPPR